MTLVAARRHDRDLPFSRQASIAKLVATDAAMKVTTDAVQVLPRLRLHEGVPGRAPHARGKMMQIFEGTNQIQRVGIARHLATDRS